MCIVYISKAFEDNIGATMHYKAIKEIYGEDNIITIDLRPISPFRNKNYIAYGKYKNSLERIRRWCQGNMMFTSNEIIAEICETIKQYHVQAVFIEDSVFGTLVKKIKKTLSDVRVITFYHDIKAVLYLEWIKNSVGRKKLVNGIEYSIGIKQERINQQYSDVNLVFNQRDADIYQKVYGKQPEGIIALPAPVPQMTSKTSPKGDVLKLLFVGKKYQPNLEGLSWFNNNVLPHLPQEVEVQIVGRGLEYLKEQYTDFRVKVIGGVESLTPYYENADVVIAPLFSGGGMKSKTVEAVSFGKYFLGTEESLFGFWEEMSETIRNSVVYSYNKAEEWIKCITTLVQNPPQKFNQELYSLFLEHFSYDAARDKLRNYLLEETK